MGRVKPLLSVCYVVLIKYKTGEAFVLGKKIPDNHISQYIGYMPQETALYEGFKCKTEHGVLWGNLRP